MLFSVAAVSYASAQDTLLISYQGRLTDGSGSPVTGTSAITFTIYDGANAPKWTEVHPAVQVDNGLFAVILGSQTALPDSVFNGEHRYLAIRVDSNPEGYPRTLLTSSPMAGRALSSNVATTADNLNGQSPSYYLDWNNLANVPAGFDDDIDDVGISGAKGDSDYVNVTGDTMSGELAIQYSGETRARVHGDNSGGYLEIYSGDEVISAVLSGDNCGQLHLMDKKTTPTVIMDAGNDSDPYLLLFDYMGSGTVLLNTGETGDYSVTLPDGSISDAEILDEPGISRTIDISTGEFPMSGVTDIVTTSITIPAPGYIFLLANCYVQLDRDNGRTDMIYLQIDEGENGNLEQPYYVGVGELDSDNSQSIPASATRTYYKAESGTYTFRLEGLRGSDMGHLSVEHPALTAMYFPTSYGSVNTVLDNATNVIDAQPVNYTDVHGKSITKYKTDLRNLELRVKEAQLKAKEAELELFKAQQKLNQSSR
jgi:hypothetical protein